MIEIAREEVEKFVKDTAFEYKPGQGAISFPLIQRIHKRLQKGIKFSSIKVAGDTITDGHHRYICLKMLNLEIATSRGGKNPTSEGFEWKKLNIESNDYDSSADIQYYKELYD